VHRVSLIGTLLPLPSIQPLPGQTVCCDTSLDTSDWCGARGQQARFQPDRWQQWPRSRGSVSVNYTRMHAYRLAVVWDRTRRRRLAAPQRPSTSLARRHRPVARRRGDRQGKARCTTTLAQDTGRTCGFVVTTRMMARTAVLSGMLALVGAQTDTDCNTAATAAGTQCCGGLSMCAMSAWQPGALTRWCQQPSCLTALRAADVACRGDSGPGATVYNTLRSVVSCQLDQCPQAYQQAIAQCPALQGAQIARLVALHSL
jgi:hypothetical protein